MHIKPKAGEATYIFDSFDMDERKALIYLKSIDKLKVKEIDINYSRLTETMLMDICDKLSIQPKFLINDKKLKKKIFEDLSNCENEDILTYLKYNPKAILTPIILAIEKSYIIKNPYDFIKKGMTFN